MKPRFSYGFYERLDGHIIGLRIRGEVLYVYFRK